MLVTLQADMSARSQVIELVSLFEGQVVDVGHDELTVSLDGEPTGSTTWRACCARSASSSWRTGRVALPKLERTAPTCGPCAGQPEPDGPRRLPAARIQDLPDDGPFDAYRLAADDAEVLFATYPGGTTIDAHDHDTDNVGVIIQGELVLTMDGVESRYGPGDWYHVPPGTSATPASAATPPRSSSGSRPARKEHPDGQRVLHEEGRRPVADRGPQGGGDRLQLAGPRPRPQPAGLGHRRAGRPAGGSSSAKAEAEACACCQWPTPPARPTS